MLELDAVIFGGGAAGLWLLDVMIGQGYRVLLLESQALGSGQTVASQGIIHGGVKYLDRGSASALCTMPARWRACLQNSAMPQLGTVRRRGEYCYLWYPKHAGLVGLKLWAGSLLSQSTVTPVYALDRPQPLRDWPGKVARLNEPVIDPRTLIQTLYERNSGYILKYDAGYLEMITSGTVITSIRIDGMTIRPKQVIFAAGEGNCVLMARIGMASYRMLRRPLHMLVLKGRLGVLNGHCMQSLGVKTRVTITTAVGVGEERYWQVGGQLAEAGVDLTPEALAKAASKELREALPESVPLGDCKWMTYWVYRSEWLKTDGTRCKDAAVVAGGNVRVVWPTKLALVPRMVDKVLDSLDSPPEYPGVWLETFGRQRRQPAVADYPWEQPDTVWRDMP